MKKTAIFYGSTTGNTMAAANEIGKLLNISEIKSVERIFADQIGSYDNIIAGVSTWGCGDIQDDWAPLVEKIGKLNLQGKNVALFGTGDQNGFGDTFVDAIGILYDAFKSAGANIVGAWPVDGYNHNNSIAIRDGQFVGLALDQDNQPDMTSKRINEWIDLLKREMGL